MIAGYVDDLRRGLSAERLAPFRPPGGSDLDMVTTYFWNVAICQSFYLSLGALEVSMRNGIHDALATNFQRVDWYDKPNLLLYREQASIADAKKKIVRSGKEIIAPRVVAALSYGFWTSILDRGYGRSIWVTRNLAVLIQQAFPYAPSHFQVRSRGHQRFNTIRSLRNRVFHFEPIWQGVPLANNVIARPADLHADVMDTIAWAAPALQATVVALDTFSEVYLSGRLQVDRQVREYLGQRVV